MKRTCLIPVLFLAVPAIAAFSAYRAGAGVVSVTSTPVPGVVSVDGAVRGGTPITLSLDGAHHISFGEYSPQYGTPAPCAVSVGAGDSLVVTGVYRNLIVPVAPPEGFASADSVFVFGTRERPLRDGTVFDYIDGGALVYLRHGLLEITHAVYRNSGNVSITLDVYDMGSPEDAVAAFDDTEICPEDHGTAEIGAPCKTYHYEPDYILYFHRSRFLVYVATDNDSLRAGVESFAARVRENIH